ncbi:DUF1573 domain-containing protein [Sediminibacterium soli]|uniref:DUF1573 domain-containing protein n=1 Tax=Sediminibacterium soli TaxID=2698829 RepID=UPI0013793D4A|nr:DUF1573 domain-containing protein [Sediminibacterium soli]NCI47116.1 DUF1573 domain-containing protein [Sediminibacterium soli]
MQTIHTTIRTVCFFGIAIVCLLMNACTNEESPAQPYANNLGIKPARLAQIDTVHFTTVEWLEPDRNFGLVNEGDSVVFDFRFRNTGSHPLFISGVKPSCGCTIAKYPEAAVMPGKESVMKVNFNTHNQPGTVHKTIIVTTNTSNGVKHVLSISGQIKQANSRK